MSIHNVELEAGKKRPAPVEVSREEALRGLKDENGKPLGKEHLAQGKQGSAQSDRALAEEFIKFLGSPAVQNALEERGKANDKKGGDCCNPTEKTARKEKAGASDEVEGNLRSLLRGLMDLVSGKKEGNCQDKKAEESHGGKGEPRLGVPEHPGKAHEPKPGAPKAEKPQPGEVRIAPVDGRNPEKTGPGTALSSSAPAAVKKFEAAIEHASRVTGPESNLIAAMIWAESRGNPREKSTNIDGHSDVGLMQISQHAYDAYVRGKNRNLPALNVNVPEQNVLAGALEMADKLKTKRGDLRAALNAYVGEGINNKYVPNVMHFYNEMKQGRTPSNEDFV